MPNRLAGETSPYLLQHAENPVDWYPWSAEALDRARREDRPILLSIGYAACHWCHVMAHESFEDPATAAVMNEHFVSVKVDREERPDLDAIYMQAVQAMTGHGGWPMTVFLTPDGEPFYGGTYFPPEDRHGMPSFTRVLHAVAGAYRSRRDAVLTSAASIRRIYDDTAIAAEDGDLTDDMLAAAYRGVAAEYDSRNGGFGGAPKFPPTMVLDFLVRHWSRTGEEGALRMARDTFVHMARGGIHDQLGGGFARYSVDAGWIVPHFEKMLYDNALLVRLGAHLWQVTGDEEIRAVTVRTIGWLAHEMVTGEGAFAASLDADSEGEEGRFYVWSAAELDSVTGADAPVARTYWGVSETGNFEGRNVLRVAATPHELATRLGMSPDAVAAAIERARDALLRERSHRARPARDDKVIASWNALTARALFDAARALPDPGAVRMAMRCLDLVHREMTHGARVLRVRARGVSRVAGFLEDHAALGLACLAAFEHTLDPTWLDAAAALERSIAERFQDSATGLFFDTAGDAERLVTRPRDVTDNAIPSGTSLAAELLLRLGDYTGNETLRARGRRVLGALARHAVRHPLAFGHLLGAAEYASTFACHGAYCDMPSPAALESAAARANTNHPTG